MVRWSCSRRCEEGGSGFFTVRTALAIVHTGIVGNPFSIFHAGANNAGSI